MKEFFTLLAFMLSLSVFSQQKYFVTESGSGFKDGSSWDNASDALSNVIDNARIGDSIWVAKGIYQGGFIMKEGVSVFGGFSGTETKLYERKLPGSNENLSVLDGNSNFRVLTQRNDFEVPTIWDGFVIQNGISQIGAGVYLRKNGVVRRCVIKNNSASLPSIGDYISTEGGVVFQIDKNNKKVWIMAEDNYGRNHQIYEQGQTNINTIKDALQDMAGKINSSYLSKSRAVQAIKSYRGGNKTDWYIPSAGEWGLFLTLNKDGSFSKTQIYELVENSLLNNGKTLLDNQKYWSSTTGTYNGMPIAWYADFNNNCINKLNVWQYNKIRGIRYYTAIDEGDGKGGGVFAIAGSRMEGCLITNNTAALGSGIYARGDVVIINSSIVYNTLGVSPASSSAIDGNSVVKVYNTVVAGNTNASGGADKLSGASYYEYSAVETPSIAYGNSNTSLNSISDAKFTDERAGNFSLLSTSPLVGAGNIKYIPETLDTDLANNARITNGKIDIGAYQIKVTAGFDHVMHSNILIYPNPIQKGGNLAINLNSSDFGQRQMTIEVCDMLGRKLISEQAYKIDHIQIPQKAGVYMVKVLVEKQIQAEYKLIITE
jgi:hypothetical protein